MWNLWAIGYNSKPLMTHASKFIINGHQNLTENEVVNCLKTYAHFNFLDLEARDSLVKNALRNSQTYTFKSLAEICESLTSLGTENTTLLNILKTQIIGIDKDTLVYQGANL